MKYLSFLIILFSINSFSDDYKSANRLQDGDVISADVFNDILDRIELTLKSASASDLVGTWDVVQTICPSGALGNCTSLSVTGAGTAVDNLYRQRADTVTFSDDGDGTFSFQTSNYCAFVRTGAGNSPCSGGYAVVDGRFILNSGGFAAYTFRKVSNTRIVLGMNASGSGSFNIIRLDKKNLAPNPPTALSASLSGSSVSLSWTASEGGATSYTVKAKTSATGTYSDVVTNNSGTTYTDTLSSGTKWYRVFAVNSDGTSVGSNVVSVSR
tara:strand:+ start:369 stop:1175 length:807 start_codon:yes stop_codon:yes gene_type:complete